MKFSNENLREEVNHSRPIVSLNQFENNDNDHFYSLSDNSELKEWTIDSLGNFIEEIETAHLYRPNEEFLTKQGHLPTKKLQSHKYFKITYSISFKHFLVNGYEDGLILVWCQEKRVLIDKKRLKKYASCSNFSLGEVLEIINKGGELKYEPPRLQDDSFTLTHNETNILNQSLEQYMKEPEKILSKGYYNIMWLHFILLGHTQTIIYLIYLPEKNMLITSSDDLTMRFFDMTSGKQVYNITLQTEARFLVYIDKPKQEKLVVLTSQNNKIEIKFGQDSLNVNTFNLPFSDIRKVLYFNKKYYLIQYTTQMLIYTFDFQLEKEIQYSKYEVFIDMIPYKNYFIFFSNDKKLHMCELVNAKLNRMFVIDIGRNTVSNLMLIDSILYMTSKDGCIYSLNVNKELELYWNRKSMADEETISIAYNKYLSSRKGMKKGKGKGKGAKGKNKTAKASSKPKSLSKSSPKKKEVNKKK